MNANIRSFPPGDRKFAEAVARVVEAVGQRLDDAALEQATTELRRSYPNAIIRWRDEMGGYAAGVCYAFRDGRIRPEDWRRERLYAALAKSREVTDDSRRILADTEQLPARRARRTRAKT